MKSRLVRNRNKVFKLPSHYINWGSVFLFVIMRTNSIEQGPSWEADSSSACPEILRMLRNPKVYYRISNSSPPVPIQSQIDPVHAFYIPLIEDSF